MATLESKHLVGLQADIAKDQARYIKSVLRQSVHTSSSGVDASATVPGSSVKAHLPVRIAAAYAEVDRLSGEKIELATRLVSLLTRAQARLDTDVAQVRALHGESAEDICKCLSHDQWRASIDQLPPKAIMVGPLNPAAQISESLRTALSGTFGSAESLSLAGTPPASVPSIHGNKSTSKGNPWRSVSGYASGTLTHRSHRTTINWSTIHQIKGHHTDSSDHTYWVQREGASTSSEGTGS